MISSVQTSRGYILALEEELSKEDILSAADTTHVTQKIRVCQAEGGSTLLK
jgi:hypothetical protein